MGFFHFGNFGFGQRRQAAAPAAASDDIVDATSDYDFDPDAHLSLTGANVNTIIDNIAAEDLPFTDINFDTKIIRLTATQHKGKNVGHCPDASGVTGSRYRSPTTPAALGITAAAGAILAVFYPTANAASPLQLITSTSNGIFLSMLSSSGDKCRVSARTSVGGTVTADVACALNAWHVAVISWTGGVLTLNVDGTESTADLTAGGGDGTIANLSAGRLDIGGQFGLHYQGYIDKVRFYSAAKNAAQRANLVAAWT